MTRIADNKTGIIIKDYPHTKKQLKKILSAKLKAARNKFREAIEDDVEVVSQGRIVLLLL